MNNCSMMFINAAMNQIMKSGMPVVLAVTSGLAPFLPSRHLLAVSFPLAENSVIWVVERMVLSDPASLTLNIIHYILCHAH